MRWVTSILLGLSLAPAHLGCDPWPDCNEKNYGVLPVVRYRARVTAQRRNDTAVMHRGSVVFGSAELMELPDKVEIEIALGLHWRENFETGTPLRMDGTMQVFRRQGHDSRRLFLRFEAREDLEHPDYPGCLGRAGRFVGHLRSDDDEVLYELSISHFIPILRTCDDVE